MEPPSPCSWTVRLGTTTDASPYAKSTPKWQDWCPPPRAVWGGGKPGHIPGICLWNHRDRKAKAKPHTFRWIFVVDFFSIRLWHQTEINRTENVQRTAARWTCRRWRHQSLVGEMLDELQWPEFQERRQQASLAFFYKIHKNLVITDKNMYLSEAGRGNRSTRSHPFRYHFLSFPGQLQLGMDLQPKMSLRRQLMGLSPKYNDLGLGRGMAWYACPWELLVNSFNWSGLSKICIVIFFLFVFSITNVPHPHLPSWSDMTECSIERKKERSP